MEPMTGDFTMATPTLPSTPVTNPQHLQNLRILAELQKKNQEQGSPPRSSSSLATRSQQCQNNIEEEESPSRIDGSATEPTRGVQKTPSLRRGAAGYNQLLQSAVMASIEVSQQQQQQNPHSMTPTSPSSTTVDEWESPSRKNKRTRQQEEHAAVSCVGSSSANGITVAPESLSRKSSGSLPRPRDTDEDEIMM
jgi:hypothetical protein